MIEKTVKSFNDGVREISFIPGRALQELRFFDLCDRVAHYRCTIPIGYHDLWPEAKKVGPCDGSCSESTVEFYKELLPWEIQEALNIKRLVPRGLLLVHQRFAHDLRPYFKIYHGGASVCPSMAKLGLLLPLGGETIVLLRGKKEKTSKAIRVINVAGKAETFVLGQVEEKSFRANLQL